MVVQHDPYADARPQIRIANPSCIRKSPNQSGQHVSHMIPAICSVFTLLVVCVEHETNASTGPPFCCKSEILNSFGVAACRFYLESTAPVFCLSIQVRRT